jgi:peptidoglycan/LPS O-acetylase OafA/YrhL
MEESSVSTSAISDPAMSMVRRPRLAALGGVRIFAALHIYFFHLKQAHDAGLLSSPLFLQLPAPLLHLIGRGHVSTGVFFQLSGFLLAYAYLESTGRLRPSAWAFWKGRFVRLYPLYFLSLLLLAPAPALLPITAKNPGALEIAGGVVTNLTLTQSWFPAFAIWWNAPAWALSAFAACYAFFPLFARLIAHLDEERLRRLVVALVVLGWVPAGVYLLVDPVGDAWSATSLSLGEFWLNSLRFNPLTWLPQFLAGAALGRLFGLQADRGGSKATARQSLSAGDLLALGMVLFLALAPWIPYVPLRHGMLSPLTLIVIADLARGGGILSRFLSWRLFSRLSEASFSLFALQMPAGLWFCIATLGSRSISPFHLLGMVGWTIGLSVLWAEAVQRPIIERLRRAAPKRLHPGRGFRGRLDAASSSLTGLKRISSGGGPRGRISEHLRDESDRITNS